MWAGGAVQYAPARPLRLDGSRAVCAEFIRDVAVKGVAGREKVFVRVERRLATAVPEEVAAVAGVWEAAAVDVAEAEARRERLFHRVRQRLWRGEEEDLGECAVVEVRNIVFLRPAASAAPEVGAGGGPVKMLRPECAPEYTHTIVPDAKLLFRFSALTFNAHAIHLDPEYCREVEGHRNLLFHGPLSFVFLMELLQRWLAGAGTGEVVKSVEYRNVAPLYCHEPVTFCGTRTGERKWEVWAQTPEGGVAVKGKVVTEVV
jgi:hydroxyacyl-ACP dehydratase HTD2-like protein with hotdog domain